MGLLEFPSMWGPWHPNLVTLLAFHLEISSNGTEDLEPSPAPGKACSYSTPAFILSLTACALLLSCFLWVQGHSSSLPRHTPGLASLISLLYFLAWHSQLFIICNFLSSCWDTHCLWPHTPPTFSFCLLKGWTWTFHDLQGYQHAAWFLSVSCKWKLLGVSSGKSFKTASLAVTAGITICYSVFIWIEDTSSRDHQPNG